ncbi:MAG: hypothetical protein ACRDPG_06995 [Nocardioidaceae bacterium]
MRRLPTVVRRLPALATSTCLLAAGLTLAGVVPASATTTCAKSATIVKKAGTGHIDEYSQATPNGAPFRGTTLTAGAHFYALHALSIRFRFGGDTYTLANNAIFAFGCSGVTRAQGAIMPEVRMLRGSARVLTTRTVLGSVSTEEGLYGPVTSNPAMTFTVSRTPKDSTLSLNQKMEWFLNYTTQPRGTSKVARVSAGKLVNVTPYVGPRIGSCRHAISALLVTKTTFGHGTATYRL